MPCMRLLSRALECLGRRQKSGTGSLRTLKSRETYVCGQAEAQIPHPQHGLIGDVTFIIITRVTCLSTHNSPHPSRPPVSHNRCLQQLHFDCPQARHADAPHTSPHCPSAVPCRCSQQLHVGCAEARQADGSLGARLRLSAKSTQGKRRRRTRHQQRACQCSRLTAGYLFQQHAAASFARRWRRRATTGQGQQCRQRRSQLRPRCTD